MRSPSPPSSRRHYSKEEYPTKIEPSWSSGGSSNSNSSSGIAKGKNTLRNSQQQQDSRHYSPQPQHERARMITDSDTDSLPDSGRSIHKKASRESMSGHGGGSEPGSEQEEDEIGRNNKRQGYTSSTNTTPTTPVKRAKRNPSIKCPICHEYVTPGQYQQHYRTELAQLESGVSNEVGRGKRGAAIAASKQFMKGKTRASASDQDKQNMLRDIQKRRGARQANKDGNGAGSGRGGRDLDLGLASALGDVLSDDSPATCFICNERLFGSLEDINTHIDACLTNPQPSRHDAQGAYSSSGANTPVSGGASGRSSTATTPNARMADSFDEYTWAGQTRIRATALFEGGMSSLGSGSRTTVQEDIDDDLNVEDDEDDEYGGAQFTERDVVLNIEDPDTDELREIAMESTTAVQRAPPSPTIASREAQRRHRGIDRDVDIEDMGDDPGDVDDDPVDEDEEIDLEGDDDDNHPRRHHHHQQAQQNKSLVEDQRMDALLSSALTSGDTRLLVEALRSKVKHLESANKNVPSCLICLEPYTVPLTSIVCWHVHCEACWMQTLGSKKLCPQCQKITLPKDLRRIYL
ncbi:MAG: hypothetical protein J3R72DRAFT_163448 [Linnemannia gamsii]|nr:MAG: hypothetical protein J3R72DRAFT_163448 [Linnemannia gamsii]